MIVVFFSFSSSHPPWDVRSGAGDSRMTPGTWERMARGVAKTSAAPLDQQSDREGSGKHRNKKNGHGHPTLLHEGNVHIFGSGRPMWLKIGWL